ncbi:SurA N-terminal domain-containing protein [Elusimicrobiota bacterium]
MMESLRKHMKKLMWGIAMMFVCGIFFWYGSGKRIKDSVAEIGDTEIKVEEYRRNVTRQLRREREKTNTDLQDDQILKIKRSVLSSMINQELLYQESKRLKITVAEEELVTTIHTLPQFQQEGTFNFNLYRETLRYSMLMKPEEFEDMIKRNIATRKLERLILSSAKVTNQELAAYYLNNNNSLEGFEDKREELRNEILQKKRIAIYQNWMRNIQQNTNISVNPKLAELQK